MIDRDRIYWCSYIHTYMLTHTCTYLHMLICIIGFSHDDNGMVGRWAKWDRLPKECRWKVRWASNGYKWRGWRTWFLSTEQTDVWKVTLAELRTSTLNELYINILIHMLIQSPTHIYIYIYIYIIHKHMNKYIYIYIYMYMYIYRLSNTCLRLLAQCLQ